MGLNFGRWLERLGYKTGEQPVLNLGAAQPVVLVGDHTHLVNHPIACSYIIGCTSPLATAGTFSTVVVFTPTPIRIRELALGASTLCDVRFNMGQASAAPVLNLPVDMNPQFLRQPNVRPALATWRYGDLASLPALTATHPSVLVTGTTTAHIIRNPLIVPANGFLRMSITATAHTIRVWALVDELPDDLPQ